MAEGAKKSCAAYMLLFFVYCVSNTELYLSMKISVKDFVSNIKGDDKWNWIEWEPYKRPLWI